MQQEKQVTPRVRVTLRVAVDGDPSDEIARLSVAELEETIRTIRELAEAYEIVSREKAAGPPGKRRARPPAERA